MEWLEIQFADQDDWEVQYDVVAYYGSRKLGSLVKSREYGWQSIIDGNVECLYDVHTEEEAKTEFKQRLKNFLNDEMNCYRELLSRVDDLD